MSNVTRQFNLDLNVYQLPNPNQVVLDADTGERLQFYRANSLDFSITFAGESGDFDMSAVGKVSLEVKQPRCSISPPRPLAPLQMYKEVEGSFSTGTPVVISFDADETAIADGVNWMSVTLYSASGERMTTVSGTVFVLGNGYGTANVPDVQDLRDRAVQAAIDAEAARDVAIIEADRSESEADRAQNIADNLQAVGEALSYRGTWAGSTAPSGAQRGYFWLISAVSVIGGVTYEVGDALLYNGTDWQRVPLDNIVQPLSDEVAYLRQQMLTRSAAGGLTFDGVSGTALAPIDGTIEGKIKTLCLVGSGSPRVAYGGYITGGWWFYRSGDNDLYTLRLQRDMLQSVYAELTWPPPSAEINHFAIIIDRTDANSVSAELFINGESQGGKSVAGDGVYSDGSGNSFGLGARGNGTTGFAASTMRNVQLFDGALSPASIAAIAASGGAIIPVADRANLLGNLACDDGNNYQCRDSSTGRNHLVLSATGVTHSIPRTPWTLSATRTGSGWIAGDRPMLSTGAEIEYASVECSAVGTVSLGYNSANAAVHFTVAHPGGGARIRVPIVDTSPSVTDRRLYLTAPAGAVVSIHLTGNIR